MTEPAPPGGRQKQRQRLTDSGPDRPPGGVASRPLLVLAQLVAAWAAGSVFLPTAWLVLLAVLFAGDEAVALAAAALGVAALLGYLVIVIRATRGVSVLGATRGGRLLWALLVLGLGTAGWALGWVVTDVAGLGVSRDLLLTAVLGGVPYALVAGTLLRGWRHKGVALGLSVALLGAGVAVLRQEPPDDLEARLAAGDLHRETAYVVAVPGYRPDGRDYGGGLGGSGFTPADPAAIPPDRFVRIVAYDRLLPGAAVCGQPTAQDADLPTGSCTAEPGGLVHRQGPVEHGYQVRVGRRYVTVVGSTAVPRDLLRSAARSLRPATARDLGDQEQTGDYYAARVPGYTPQLMGIPAGLVYMPSDHTGNGGQSVHITLSVSQADDDLCYLAQKCTPVGSGLTYVRREDTHGYAVRRGTVTVQVLGGLRVDAEPLRRAALDARPATDAELRRLLPPLEPRTPLDRLRRWLRTF
ncbi:hypothetical protein AB0C33_02435 [Nonomuraea sp. NPDC048881]|uniref:hypothetical protein n=1 Tax=Nonomuraea sp. NPDC048881 TaxID=3155030 RepID=UPI0033FAB43B